MLQKPVIQERDCEICGYQLRGLPKTALSVCPECGSVFDAERPPSKLRHVGWALVVVCVVTAHVAFTVGQHDKFGMPMSIEANIALLVSMAGTVVFSIAAMCLSPKPAKPGLRALIGFGIGCVVCSIGTCMGWLVWN